MNNAFFKEVQLIGVEAFKKLNDSHVAVFGLGGVGSYVVEGLVRGGVLNITLIDCDVYSESNINRQLYATQSTIGKKKVEVAKNRILDINPNCKVNVIDKFILKDTINEIDFTSFTYVVDAIDTISGKLEIVKKCNELGVKVISCMGTGNKINPLAFKVADIKQTKVCPLCKVMRKLLKDNGIASLKVVYSEEEPKAPINSDTAEKKGNGVAPSSISFVPSVAGLIIAGEVIKDIINL